MQTSMLRNRVTIQVPIRSRGPQGSYVVKWAVLREVYCRLFPVSAPYGGWRARATGHERSFAGKTRGDITHSFAMRAQPEWLTVDMRLVESIKQKDNPNYRVFQIIEALELENIDFEMKVDVKESLSDIDTEAAQYTVMTNDHGQSMTGNNREYIVS